MAQKIELSKTIHLLGEILGLVIKEQEGSLIFNKVEKIRVLSKASRGKGNQRKKTILLQSLNQQYLNFLQKKLS